VKVPVNGRKIQVVPSIEYLYLILKYERFTPSTSVKKLGERGHDRAGFIRIGLHVLTILFS
jgi:hypothetical protein